jgi:CRP/FNR family cyclic AMP-dependent transcriptional regulator
VTHCTFPTCTRARGRAEFEKRTIRHPEIYQYLISVMATRLRETDEAMAATSFLTVQARLARAILELGKHVGQDAVQ